MELPKDPFILELLPEFIETWIGDLENFYDYKKNNQLDELYRMAHTLKGSCYQFGINDIGDWGVEMMACAKNSDWAGATTLFDKVKEKFLEVDKYLSENNIK